MLPTRPRRYGQLKEAGLPARNLRPPTPETEERRPDRGGIDGALEGNLRCPSAADYFALHTMGIWIQTGTRLSRLRAGVNRMIGAIFKDASSRSLCPEETAMREF